MAERSKALWLSCRGLAVCGFESRWRHIFSFWIFRSLPVPNRSTEPLQNEIKHVHSPEVIVVFRPQIQLIIQGFVYSYLQYSFKYTWTELTVFRYRRHISCTDSELRDWSHRGCWLESHWIFIYVVSVFLQLICGWAQYERAWKLQQTTLVKS